MADYSKYADVSMPVTVEDHIMTIKFNRPDRRNAIGPGMHEALEEILTTVNNDEDIRVIVITGEGDKAFCAGADVRGLQATKASGTRPPGNTLRGAKWLIHHFLNVEVPMVAAINGDAVGLGATLALMCDITIMADTARIGDTHVKVGIVAGDGGPLMWPFLIGMNRAKEALMTGRLLHADECERIGLVNKVTPQQDCLPEAMRLARELAAGAPSGREVDQSLAEPADMAAGHQHPPLLRRRRGHQLRHRGPRRRHAVLHRETPAQVHGTLAMPESTTLPPRIISADDHMDLHVLPFDLFESRLPKELREVGPRVVEMDRGTYWFCEGRALGARPPPADSRPP